MMWTCMLKLLRYSLHYEYYRLVFCFFAMSKERFKMGGLNSSVFQRDVPD